MEVKERITKDLKIFDENIKKVEKSRLDKKQAKVVELSEMYARDAKAWLEKGDYYTAFSSISYAHGLLDSVIMMNSQA
jgi:hypothetical protein